ncbi:MAG: hypothetical protein H6706_17405 [Myxococcales bacterium]|nr:hypothetical protein [Myxococcales bacterium]
MRALWVTLCLLPTAGWACEVAELAKVVEALGAIEPRHQPALAGRGLVLACPDWPAPILAGLDGLAAAPPEMRVMLEARAVAEAPFVWTEACPGGLRAAAQLSELAPDQRRGHLYRACDVERAGFASQAEFEAATGALLLPIPVAGLLAKTPLPAGDRRRILRGLAGVVGPEERAQEERARAERPVLEPVRFIDPIEVPPEPMDSRPSGLGGGGHGGGDLGGGPGRGGSAVVGRGRYGTTRGLVVRRVRLAAGCPAARMAQIRAALDDATSACRAERRPMTAHVELAVTIDRGGAVSDVRVANGTLRPSAQHACLAKALAASPLPAAEAPCVAVVEALGPE